jgi:hypothetical protein
MVPFAGYSMVRADGRADGNAMPLFFAELMRIL